MTANSPHLLSQQMVQIVRIAVCTHIDDCWTQIALSTAQALSATIAYWIHRVALIGLAIEVALAVEGLLGSPDKAFPIFTHIFIIEGRPNRVCGDALRFLALLIRSEDTAKIKIIHCDMPIFTREGRCPPP